MRVFALTIIIISYCIIFVSLFIYVLLFALKKYRLAIIMEKITFLCALFSTCNESWALVLMNKGNDFNLEAELDVDYSYGLFIVVPAFIILIVLSRLINKYKNSEHIYFKIGDYLLPVATTVAIAFSTFVVFFSVGYYDFLKETEKFII